MSARRKAGLAALKWAAIALVGLCLFLWVKADAEAWRGRAAVGGEYLLLLLPLWWWLAERTFGDFVRCIKAELFISKKHGGNRR